MYRVYGVGVVGVDRGCWGGDLRWKFKEVLNMNCLEGVWKEEIEWVKIGSSKVLGMEENFGEK